MFHTCIYSINAFDDGADDVVMDLAAYPDASIIFAFTVENLRNSKPGNDGKIPFELAQVQRFRLPDVTRTLVACQTANDPKKNPRAIREPLKQPPSAGKAIIAANLASGFDLANMSEADRVHTMLECMRLGFADAQQWVCDPYVVPIPLAELTSMEYADRRRQRIHPKQAAQKVPYGDPMAKSDTVYLCTADGEGNACSFINSLYMGTGSGLVVPGTGVSLQNRAATFVLDPGHPNALAPNKRPYQTIIPAMTVKDGELHAALGVMGGYMQPQGHFQMLVNLVDFDMSPQLALDMPRWQLAGPSAGMGRAEEGGRVMMEEGWSFATLSELARRGHRITPVDGYDRISFGGGQIIMRNPVTGVLTAGSEPRKDGCAVGW